MLAGKIAVLKYFQSALGLAQLTQKTFNDRWALHPISVISDIGLSLISELPISNWESGVQHYIGYRKKGLSDIRHTNLNNQAQYFSVLALAFDSKGCRFKCAERNIFFLQCRISEWSLMSISENFRYRNDVFYSDIFVSDIGQMLMSDVGYRRHLRSMLMPTYA